MSSDLETNFIRLDLQTQSNQFCQISSDWHITQMQHQSEFESQLTLTLASTEQEPQQKQENQFSKTEKQLPKRLTEQEQGNDFKSERTKCDENDSQGAYQQQLTQESDKHPQQQKDQQNGNLHDCYNIEKQSDQQLPRLQQKEQFLKQQKLLQQSQQVSEIRRVASYNSADKYARSGGSNEQKRVQFADEMGLHLTQVRVMSEPSWVPPMLSCDFLTRLKLTQSEIESASDSDSDAATCTLATSSQYECRFEQPVSRYILFRENLERNCVCLSSIHFEGCTARCVINVKNVCFDKRVFLRATFDSWHSYKDFDATYSSVCDGGAHDSFSLSFSCPMPAVDFEFCVCFEAVSLGQAFWDNAGGKNYRVAASLPIANRRKKQKKTRKSRLVYVDDPVKKFSSSENFLLSFEHVTEFSVCAAWDRNASRVYY